MLLEKRYCECGYIAEYVYCEPVGYHNGKPVYVGLCREQAEYERKQGRGIVRRIPIGAKREIAG